MRLAVSTFLVLLLAGASSARSESELPDRTLLRSGDLLWPKPPGAFVPYASGAERTQVEDKFRWDLERSMFLATEAAKDDKLDAERRELLKSMDYSGFVEVYGGTQRTGMLGASRGGGLYIGHVAIVEIQNGKDLWVIEAVGDHGVSTKTYDEWLKGRSGQIVWHGRLKGLADGDGEKIVAEARKVLGKPYDFWNFDLNDDSGFYCSKLVWQAVYRALGIAIDNNKDPKRLLWLSPKQMLRLDGIELLNDPGRYAPP